MIPWRSIAELPDELLDGRKVLLWETVADNGPVLASWDRSNKWLSLCKGVWCDEGGNTVRGATHFAEINKPIPPIKSAPIAGVGWYALIQQGDDLVADHEVTGRHGLAQLIARDCDAPYVAFWDGEVWLDITETE